MASSTVVVNLPKEMDRKVAILVQVASQYNARIHLICGNKKVNAKSIMGMMTLDLGPGAQVQVSVDGEDETAAIEKIEEYLSAD